MGLFLSSELWFFKTYKFRLTLYFIHYITTLITMYDFWYFFTLQIIVKCIFLKEHRLVFFYLHLCVNILKKRIDFSNKFEFNFIDLEESLEIEAANNSVNYLEYFFFDLSLILLIFESLNRCLDQFNSNRLKKSSMKTKILIVFIFFFNKWFYF